MTAGFVMEARMSNAGDDLDVVFQEIARHWVMDNGRLHPFESDPDQAYIRMKMGRANMKEIIPPVGVLNIPQQLDLLQQPDSIPTMMKKADLMRFEEILGTRVCAEAYQKYVVPETIKVIKEVVPLRYLCMRKVSLFQYAYGKTNGRPHIVSATSNMYPRKYADAVLLMARPIQKLPPQAAEVMALLPDALPYMYSRMGTLSHLSKYESRLSMKDSLQGVPLSTSSGINKGGVEKVEIEGQNFIISARGKKFEVLADDLTVILDFLNGGPEPPCYWNVVAKNENFVSFVKQLDDKEWNAFVQKLRVFVIPSSIFVVVERMTSEMRQHLERGAIRIGQKHGHGGGDITAKMLGINKDNCFKPIIVEGDVKKHDQSIQAVWTELYLSATQVYEKQGSAAFDAKRKLVRWLIKWMVAQCMHLFGEIWVSKIGGVPSGAFNTSHMDSWVLLLWYVLFGLHTINTARDEDKEVLEKWFVEQLLIIVYGDDHLYNKSDHPVVSSYFSGVNFSRFLKHYFDVDLRDIKDGIAFCSVVKDGWLVKEGASFLKHQYIVNPLHMMPKQPYFLPFRETREYIIRAVWGRESKVRSLFDVLLSILGHAYGTSCKFRCILGPEVDV